MEPFDVRGKIVPLPWVQQILALTDEGVRDLLKMHEITIRKQGGLEYVLGDELIKLFSPHTKAVAPKYLSLEEERLFMEQWNDFATQNGLRRITAISEEVKHRRSRLAKLIALLQKREMSFFEFLQKLRGLSDYYFGNNERGWKLNFDYIIRPGKAEELLERLESTPAVGKREEGFGVKEDEEEPPF